MCVHREGRVNRGGLECQYLKGGGGGGGGGQFILLGTTHKRAQQCGRFSKLGSKGLS